MTSEYDLLGQTVVVIGGSSGIGLETARRARAEGAEVVLTGRNPDRLDGAASEVGARSTAAFDATDLRRLAGFFADLEPGRPHHGHRRRPVLRAAGRDGLRRGAPRARRAPDGDAPRGPPRAETGCDRAAPCVFIGGTGARRPRCGLGVASAVTAALPALTRQPGPRAGAGPGQPDRRRLRRHAAVGRAPRGRPGGARDQLRATLPIGRVVGPADVAALAVHLMTNTALTGATYDIDGGQQIVPG